MGDGAPASSHVSGDELKGTPGSYREQTTSHESYRMKAR